MPPELLRQLLCRDRTAGATNFFCEDILDKVLELVNDPFVRQLNPAVLQLAKRETRARFFLDAMPDGVESYRARWMRFVCARIEGVPGSMGHISALQVSCYAPLVTPALPTDQTFVSFKDSLPGKAAAQRDFEEIVEVTKILTKTSEELADKAAITAAFYQNVIGVMLASTRQEDGTLTCGDCTLLELIFSVLNPGQSLTNITPHSKELRARRVIAALLLRIRPRALALTQGPVARNPGEAFPARRDVPSKKVYRFSPVDTSRPIKIDDGNFFMGSNLRDTKLKETLVIGNIINRGDSSFQFVMPGRAHDLRPILLAAPITGDAVPSIVELDGRGKQENGGRTPFRGTDIPGPYPKEAVEDALQLFIECKNGGLQPFNAGETTVSEDDTPPVRRRQPLRQKKKPAVELPATPASILKSKSATPAGNSKAKSGTPAGNPKSKPVGRLKQATNTAKPAPAAVKRSRDPPGESAAKFATKKHKDSSHELHQLIADQKQQIDDLRAQLIAAAKPAPAEVPSQCHAPPHVAAPNPTHDVDMMMRCFGLLQQWQRPSQPDLVAVLTALPPLLHRAEAPAQTQARDMIPVDVVERLMTAATRLNNRYNIE